MKIEDEIAQIFEQHQWTWNLKQGEKVPDTDDIEAALDEAARLLFNEEAGTQLEVGRLIIRKLHTGHDVYVYVGEYE